MAMRTLMSILTACYGENQNINHIFVETLKDNLGSDISVTQAKTLANRLVSSHKFSPSISEIVARMAADEKGDEPPRLRGYALSP
mgnify:CR=1 FL=1